LLEEKTVPGTGDGHKVLSKGSKERDELPLCKSEKFFFKKKKKTKKNFKKKKKKRNRFKPTGFGSVFLEQNRFNPVWLGFPV
jgi:hypothetical protein